MLKPRSDGGLTVQKILEKTYYNVSGHQPESLDWFNVLVAQTIAQLRADAQEDEALLTSLTTLMNGGNRPDFLDEIKVTEISLGDEFPIFSNCRVIPVDENGTPLKQLTGQRGERLQARMDVDLSDVLTLGVETKLVLNYPKPFVMVLPVALAVSVVRFSGTLSLSFSPSSQSNPFMEADAAGKEATTGRPNKNEGHPQNPTGQSPTTLTFTFLDDYRLDLSVRSLIGSRSRLQDVPKIAQLIEGRIHQWFDERCVEPRFQQIVLPSLWPRMKNTRGGQDESTVDGPTESNMSAKDTPKPGNTSYEEPVHHSPPGGLPSQGTNVHSDSFQTMAQQRTRDWAVQQHMGVSGKRKEEMSEIELAGQEMREADERARKREQARLQSDHVRNHEGIDLRRRANRGASLDGRERTPGIEAMS